MLRGGAAGGRAARGERGAARRHGRARAFPREQDHRALHRARPRPVPPARPRRSRARAGADLPAARRRPAAGDGRRADPAQGPALRRSARWPGCPDARLALVGTGPDERALERSRARAGWRSACISSARSTTTLLPAVLSAADAMVLPSASEGLANAWVEALACGCPLVITDAGGAREVVTEPAGRPHRRARRRRDRRGGARAARRIRRRGEGGRRRMRGAVQLGSATPRRWRRTTTERICPSAPPRGPSPPRGPDDASASLARQAFLAVDAVSVGTKLSERDPSQIRIGAAM